MKWWLSTLFYSCGDNLQHHKTNFHFEIPSTFWSAANIICSRISRQTVTKFCLHDSQNLGLTITSYFGLSNVVAPRMVSIDGCFGETVSPSSVPLPRANTLTFFGSLWISYRSWQITSMVLVSGSVLPDSRYYINHGPHCKQHYTMTAPIYN